MDSPGTCTELGTRGRFSGTRARPRKRVNGKAAAEVRLINTRFFYFILLFTDIFSGRHELLAGSRKNFWSLILADLGIQTEKRLPTLALGLSLHGIFITPLWLPYWIL